MSKASLILALTVIAAVYPAAGNEPGAFSVRAITVEDGLSHDTTYALLQDSSGWVWVGTEEGLDRYDSYGFRHFGRAERGDDGLAVEDVSTLLEDSQGAIWIGLWGGGVDRFDPRTETFTHFQHDPEDPSSLSDDRTYTLYEDSAERLWVTTYNGLCRLASSGRAFVCYHHDPTDPDSLANDRVWAVVEGSDQRLWVGTDAGLDRFDPTTGTAEHFRHDPTDPATISHDRVRAVLVDRSGVLWIGTGQGLDRLDQQTGIVTRVAGKLVGETVTALFEGQEGSLWIGTRRGAMLRLDVATGTLEPWLDDPDQLELAIMHEVEGFIADTTGILWVATRGSGLRLIDLEPKLFRHRGYRPGDPAALPHGTVLSVHVDRAGTLWIGTQGGLTGVPADGSDVIQLRSQPGESGLSHSNVRALLEDSDGALWIGGDQGLDCWDRDTGAFTHFEHDRSQPSSLAHNRVLALIQDHTGRLWVGTRNGLDRFEPDTGTFWHCCAEGFERGLGDRFIRCLYEDREHTIWIGTEVGGLHRYDPATGELVRFRHRSDDPTSLSDNRVFMIHQDQDGNMWIGTGHGLNRFQSETGKFRRFFRDDGLPSDVINGILEDDKGRLWISTNGGICRFDVYSETVRTYGRADGLEGLFFSRGACASDSWGRMHFGSLNGLVSFSPSMALSRTTAPNVVLTGFWVFSQPLELPVTLAEVERIDLRHDQHTFRIEFASLDYSAPEGRRYAYRLEGYDPDWIFSSNRRDVRYAHVRPGTYTFRVRAASRDGVWNEQGISLVVRVAPPFWQRWWFRGLVMALLVAAVLALHTTRVKVIQRQKQRLEEVVRERTRELRLLNEKKDEFLGIAAHDLRSPLASVTSYTDLLLRLLDQEKIDRRTWHRFLGNIRKVSEQMRLLVDDLLDVAAIETGRLELHPQSVRLTEVFDECRSLHEQAAEAKGISLMFDPTAPELCVLADPARLVEVLDNLVTNALKFTESGGIVRVWCEVEGQQVAIRVQDTGQGLDEDELAHVFTGKKLSARPTGGESSTGLGLVIVRKIIELHGGTVTVDSKKGRGSTFSFSLPSADASTP